MENKIPPEFFFRHVEKVREIWSNVFFRRFQRGNYDMDSVILVNGKGNGGNEKTIAIVSWFFAGYNLADTIIAISQKAIIIYASDRKGKTYSMQSPFWPI
jgi:nucleosome binding factor SPN SPT16 subunit